MNLQDQVDAIEARLSAVEDHPALAVPPLFAKIACSRCGEPVGEDEEMDGCRDPRCPNNNA